MSEGEPVNEQIRHDTLQEAGRRISLLRVNLRDFTREKMPRIPPNREAPHLLWLL